MSRCQNNNCLCFIRGMKLVLSRQEYFYMVGNADESASHMNNIQFTHETNDEDPFEYPSLSHDDHFFS